MMHKPRFPTVRKLLAALLPGVLAAPALLGGHAAHAASLVLFSLPGTVHVCQATVWSRNSSHAVAQSDYLWADAWGASLDIGAFPADADLDTPEFGALKLRCWIAPTLEGAPLPTEPSYSLKLDRNDGAWEVLEPGGEQLVRVLPRDGRTLFLMLERTASAERPIRIAYATLSHRWRSSPEDTIYGPLMHRHFDAD